MLSMRTILIIALATTGCLKPVPPQPEIPQVIVVTEITPPHVPEIVVMDASPEVPPVKTWMSEEDIAKHRKEEARKSGECVCEDGDPLCECLP